MGSKQYGQETNSIIELRKALGQYQFNKFHKSNSSFCNANRKLVVTRRFSFVPSIDTLLRPPTYHAGGGRLSEAFTTRG